MSTRLQPPQKQDHQPGRETEMRPRPEYEPKYPGVGKLKDKVALITGGDSGIGRAVAVAMAREGAKIAVQARSGRRSFRRHSTPTMSPSMARRRR